MNQLRQLRLITIRRYCSCKPLRTEKPTITKNEKSPELVPRTPVKSKLDLKKLPARTKIDSATIALLERLSLVDCANRKGIETLEEAIAFADQIQLVDTKGIEPLVSVLEDRPLRVRDDCVNEGNCKEDVLKNAALTEEEYFVAPPGNIPLEARENPLHEEQGTKKS